MSEQLTFHRGGTKPGTGREAARPKAEVGAARAATDHDASYLRVFVFAPFFFFSGDALKFTAIDAYQLGMKVHLIEDACRGVNLKPGDVSRAVQETRSKGVEITDSASV